MAPVSSGCRCTDGQVSFFQSLPAPETCWRIADGTSAPLDMLVRGGLYVRAGPLDAVGKVLDSATGAENLTVAVDAGFSEGSFDGVVGNRDTGIEFPELYRLSPQAIQASHGSTRGWTVLPNITATSTIHSSATETRPVSITLLPAVCIRP